MLTYKIGDILHIENEGYYSGEGKIKSIETWKNGRLMIAVYFTGKGTVWFDTEYL